MQLERQTARRLRACHRELEALNVKAPGWEMWDLLTM